MLIGHIVSLIPRLDRRRLAGAMCDRWIAASSLVSTNAVVDVRDCPWTATLRDGWRLIRDEIAGRPAALWAHGVPIAGAAAHYPQTCTILATIPGIDAADVAILAPGAHQPTRRGVSKALLTCHLGLVVPRDGDVRMRIGDRIVRWAEGETLVFDDSRDHEVWNDADAARIVLTVRVARPLRNPGRWLAERVLRVSPPPARWSTPAAAR